MVTTTSNVTQVNVTQVTELLEALNNADPATVWDDVINPRLTPAEHDLITDDMQRRSTFIHHDVPYARSYYTRAWTTLLTDDNLDPAIRTTFNRAVLDQALTAAHHQLRAAHPHVFPAVHRCAGSGMEPPRPADSDSNQSTPPERH